jgi:hypothetical protein
MGRPSYLVIFRSDVCEFMDLEAFSFYDTVPAIKMLLFSKLSLKRVSWSWKTPEFIYRAN